MYENNLNHGLKIWLLSTVAYCDVMPRVELNLIHANSGD